MSRPMRRPFAPARRPLASGAGGSSSKGGPSRAGLPTGQAGRAGTSAKTADDGYLYIAGVKDPSKRMVEYRDDRDTCPVCHTDRQFNKSLRLLVSPCYHKMCESCIDRLFTLGPEPCPTCGKILRKVNFAHQTFEDLKVEKEVSVRRRMAEVFNKREEDFESAREYDDYLEEVENLTFNLLNDMDLPDTEKRIAEYTRKNEAVITANKQKAGLEAMGQAERDDFEKRAREERMRMVEEAERLERVENERVKADIVAALASGSVQKADELRRAHEATKAARALNLAASLPKTLTQPEPESEVQHTPLSPSYAGPYVALPFDDPDQAAWTTWYTLKADYVDGRSGVVAAKGDKDGKFRGGAWDLSQFWEMEIRAAVESLGIEPLA